eukprot:CAMPEP_0117649548 /NCGR_PEP_ID=MMETSP0804-20121206/1034_1 /TAXON_ID=1074897 /ORGANISM="Tetraselmis astigmatica, Strain CCMP880" /LENGTH=186 /DNA_ID=CAMNT_0005455299 /DNA_START=327 /DNA_END=888 /DNA_ORIENTATION=-
MRNLPVVSMAAEERREALIPSQQQFQLPRLLGAQLEQSPLPHNLLISSLLDGMNSGAPPNPHKQAMARAQHPNNVQQLLQDPEGAGSAGATSQETCPHHRGLWPGDPYRTCAGESARLDMASHCADIAASWSWMRIQTLVADEAVVSSPRVPDASTVSSSHVRVSHDGTARHLWKSCKPLAVTWVQ